jgi:hypothetical protein
MAGDDPIAGPRSPVPSTSRSWLATRARGHQRDVLVCRRDAPATCPTPSSTGFATRSGDAPPVATAAEADPLAPIEVMIAARDFSGGLVVAEALLERSPGHEGAAASQSSAAWLADLYQARGRGRRPHLAVPRRRSASTASIGGLPPVSRFDGQSDRRAHRSTGFTRLDTLRLLYELVQRGIVRIERRVVAEPQPPSGGAVLAR